MDIKEKAKELGVHELVVRIMNDRGIDDMESWLHPSKEDFHSPYLLPNVEVGARILARKISEKAKIRIIGDYDVDGVCATYILYKRLRGLMYECPGNVSYALPERKKHGYGLNEILIDEAYADGIDTIVTCDNGIAEKESIRKAKDLGMTVIVTDHHNVPDEIPEADAVIDPKIKNEKGEYSYPFRDICGAVVAMKFMQVVYDVMGKDPTTPFSSLEFAALATVCDVMPLVDENRAIVSIGLRRMKVTRNKGLRALLDLNGVKEPKAWHCGYTVGPCVNAAGRLETADEAFKLFISNDKDEIKERSEHLVALNETRKKLTDEGIKEAFTQIDAERPDKVIVAYLPNCMDSIAGIVAGKVKDALHRPVLIVTGKGDVLKGSARSISKYSLYDEMAKGKELFVKFGGHPLAAGFSIKKENVDTLRGFLNDNCPLTEKDLEYKTVIDAEYPIRYVSKKLVNDLSLLEPFGTGNPTPNLSSNEVLLKAWRIGKEKNYLRMTFSCGDRKINAVSFEDADTFFAEYRHVFSPLDEKMILDGTGKKKIRFIYRPEIDSYKGRERIDYKISEFLL